MNKISHMVNNTTGNKLHGFQKFNIKIRTITLSVVSCPGLGFPGWGTMGTGASSNLLLFLGSMISSLSRSSSCNISTKYNMNSMKTCDSVTFYFKTNSFSDIGRKCIVLNMIVNFRKWVFSLKKMWRNDKFHGIHVPSITALGIEP